MRVVYTMVKQYSITAYKSRYPPGNHHANHLQKMSYFQVTTTC